MAGSDDPNVLRKHDFWLQGLPGGEMMPGSYAPHGLGRLRTGSEDLKKEMGAIGYKDDAGKLRYSLIPPDALREVVQVYTDGAAKYGDDNWLKGMSHKRVFDALMRHAQAWLQGEDVDQDPPGDAKQYHMAAVAWCALALLTYRLRGLGTDDRTPIK